MSDVMPCPFCGYDDPEIDEPEMLVYAIVCPNCSARGPIEMDADGTSQQSPRRAIELWNKRKETETC